MLYNVHVPFQTTSIVLIILLLLLLVVLSRGCFFVPRRHTGTIAVGPNDEMQRRA